ncbi:MAG: TatD family hydrolase [Anaerolineae bacterium]|nr:TatD family hydrolase [Anaerolineae bacterium]
MMLVDTHCHIDFNAYDEDREAVIRRAAEVGVMRIVNPAVDVENSRGIAALARQYPGLYATVGIHPTSTANFTPAMIDELAALAREPKVVAVGEIGLDYYWDKTPKDIQVMAFRAQLDLASRLELPVIIHNR